MPSPAKRKASNLDDDSSGDESETLKAAVLAIDAPIGAPGTNQGAPDDASTVHVRHCFTTCVTRRAAAAAAAFLSLPVLTPLTVPHSAPPTPDTGPALR